MKCFLKKKHDKNMFFMVEKAKHKVLLEHCKCFFKKYSSPAPGYGSGFISVNLDNIFDQ